MRFAVNFSYPLVRLIKAGAIRVDLIKCPDWEGMLTEAEPYGPITIHFDLKAGLGHTFKADFSRIKTLLKQTDTPHVNTHLVTPRHFDPNNQEDLVRINQLWREEILLMTHHFGASSVALEHFPYTDDTPHLRTPVQSDIFSKVIQDTDCMLLLDLAHARITADTLGVDVKDYVQSLPLDRLIELHVTGVKSYHGILTDHFEMLDEDWAVFEWALSEIKNQKWREPEIVAFEYGGVGQSFVWRTEENHLRKQVPLMHAMVHNQAHIT